MELGRIILWILLLFAPLALLILSTVLFFVENHRYRKRGDQAAVVRRTTWMILMILSGAISTVVYGFLISVIVAFSRGATLM